MFLGYFGCHSYPSRPLREDRGARRYGACLLKEQKVHRKTIMARLEEQVLLIFSLAIPEMPFTC